MAVETHDLEARHLHKLIEELALLIRGREPIYLSRRLSALQQVAMDYKDRKHVFVLSPVAFTLSQETYGSQPIPAQQWTLIDCDPGMLLNAVGLTTPIDVMFCYTDELISADNVIAQLPGNIFNTSDGGRSTTPIAASVATDTVIKASSGVLCRVLITTAGTNALSIFDNASGHTGTLLGFIEASAVAGTIRTFNFPAANGITVQGNANNPAVTIGWE